MKIPEYEQSVGINPTPQPEAKVPGVLSPTPMVDLGKPLEELGNTGMKLGLTIQDHIEKQRILDNKAIVDTFSNDLKQKYQEKLYDTTEEKYTDPISGEERVRAAGIMNQFGADSQDAYLKSKVLFDTMAKERADKIKDPVAKADFLRDMFTYRVSATGSALKHQSDQYRVGLGKTFIASLENLTLEASTAQDKVQLQPLLKKVSDKVDDYAASQGATPDVKQRLLDDWTQKAVEKAVMGKLHFSGGDMEAATSLLDSVSIPESTHALIAEKIQTQGKQIADRVVYIKKQEELQGRLKLANDFASGKETAQNLSPEAQALVDKDVVLSSAVNKAKQSKRGYLPEERNADILKSFDDASKATDRDAIGPLAADLISKSGANSADELGLALFYMQKRASVLRLSEKDINPIEKATTKEEMEMAQIDAGVNNISRWAKNWDIDTDVHLMTVKDYMSKIKSGISPYEALTSSLKSSNIMLHPNMINYPAAGQMLVDAKGRMAMAYPDGTITPVGQPQQSKTQPASKGKVGKKEESISWESLN